MTQGIYIPEPLVLGLVAAIEQDVPTGTDVGIGEESPTPRFVNLWPGAPTTIPLVMGGPVVARVSVQATSVGKNLTDARKLGSLVRYALGRSSRGAFRHPLSVPGFKIMDIVSNDGRADNSGGVAVWHETFDITYSASTVPPDEEA